MIKNSIEKYQDLLSFFLIIVTIAILSFILPKYYKDIFSSIPEDTRVYYSPVLKDFVKIVEKRDNKRIVKYYDFNGNEYTQKKFQELLPFTYYINLKKWNRFPKEFDYSTQKINKSMQFFRVKASNFNSKELGLNTLFESNSDFDRLTIPDDMFRLKNGIEFIDSFTNKVNKEKSELFTKALKQKGASFPIKKAFGYPNVKKDFDEGYFLLDSKENIFHFKMNKAKPEIYKVNTKGIKLSNIVIQEHPRKEYYGIAISKENKVYFLLYKDYKLVSMKLKNYNKSRDNLSIFTNPLHTMVSTTSIKDETVYKSVYVYENNSYKLINSKHLSYKMKRSEFYKMSKNILFPFESSIYTKLSNIIIPKFILNSYEFFFGSFFMLFIYIIYLISKKAPLSKHKTNMLIILLSGIYGIIAIIMFSKLRKTKEELITHPNIKG